MGYVRGTCRASAMEVWVVRRAGCEQLFRCSGAMRCATASGVHAADVSNAFKKNNAALVDTVYSGIPASLVDRTQESAVGPMSG